MFCLYSPILTYSIPEVFTQIFIIASATLTVIIGQYLYCQGGRVAISKGTGLLHHSYIPKRKFVTAAYELLNSIHSHHGDVNDRLRPRTFSGRHTRLTPPSRALTNFITQYIAQNANWANSKRSEIIGSEWLWFTHLLPNDCNLRT